MPSARPENSTSKPRRRCSRAHRSKWNSGTSVPVPVSAASMPARSRSRPAGRQCLQNGHQIAGQFQQRALGPGHGRRTRAPQPVERPVPGHGGCARRGRRGPGRAADPDVVEPRIPAFLSHGAHEARQLGGVGTKRGGCRHRMNLSQHICGDGLGLGRATPAPACWSNHRSHSAPARSNQFLTCGAAAAPPKGARRGIAPGGGSR